MKTKDIRNLSNTIEIPKSIEYTFNLYKKIMSNSEISELEIFYAGYMLSNPVVRESFLFSEKNNEKIENKNDNRIQNTIWK